VTDGFAIRPLFLDWDCVETLKLQTWTFEPSLNLGIVEYHYSQFWVEKYWNVFIKNLNFFSNEVRKTCISSMTSVWANY